MTLPSLSTTYRQPSLEERRATLQQQDVKLNEGRKAFALDLYRLRLSWGLLYPRSSTREFIAWFNDGEVQTRLYAYLRAGVAIEAGLDAPGLLFGTLAAYGERLEGGETVQSIRDGNPPSLPERTSIRVTRETADKLTQLAADLSESDGPHTREMTVEKALDAITSTEPVFRRALFHAAATGENPLDALVKAVDERRDWRAWMSRQGCASCGVRPVELHHLRVGQDVRFRTNEVLLPVCTRHHIARPGDTIDAAHAAHQEDWIVEHFGSPERFWLQVALLYVRYAQESESPHEEGRQI